MSSPVKIMLTKLDRHMVSIHPIGAGIEARVVKVWTWPDGPQPTMQGKFPVSSLDVARMHVVPGALRMTDPRAAEFAEEVYMYTPPEQP